MKIPEINRIITKLVLFLLYFGHIYGQSEYPFINHSLNTLDGAKMEEWKKNLQELRQGQKNSLTILHFGGSHVQAGVWSHTFLKNLMEEEKIKVKGYIFFPYSLIKSNHPVYIHTYAKGKWKKCRSVLKDLCSPLGPMGVSAQMMDTLSVLRIALSRKDALLREFKQLYIRYILRGNIRIQCTWPEHAVVKTDSMKVTFEFSHPTDSVEILFLRTDSASQYHILYAGVLLPDENGVIFGAMGANGASAESMLRVSGMQYFMHELNPDWILLSYGVNDVQGKNFHPEHFFQNYDTLTTRMSANNKTKILLMGITDNYIRRKGCNKRTRMASETLRTLAAKKGYWYWPLFEVMGGYKSIQKWYRAGLARRDRIHLTHKGYTLLANLMTQAFYQKLNDNSP